MSEDPVGGEYDVLTTSAPIDNRTRILKFDDAFGVFDRFGDIEPFNQSQLGLYYGDTRFLSKLRLRLENERPLLLDSTVSRDNSTFRVDLMNVDVRRGDEVVIPHGTLHLLRSKSMGQASCLELARFHNYALMPVELTFAVEFDADFADIFEIRGLPRSGRGQMHAPVQRDGSLVLAYDGLDGRRRTTRIELEPTPEWRGEGRAFYRATLDPHGEAIFAWRIVCAVEQQPTERPVVVTGSDIAGLRPSAVSHVPLARARVRTSNDLFNDWLDRSRADIAMLTSSASGGPYPHAGVPWFSTAFGRDGILTALECLWIDPELARGVLAYLAATQSCGVHPERDEQPGKIIHESRSGEMAALLEVPFGRYYGSVDATPLFVTLAGAYYDRTADEEFARAIWPHVIRALEWIDGEGDPDGDGFCEYERMTPTGLLHQGWKDSQDPVFHADGTLAEGPIALVEVQGYVYAARRAAARLAEIVGEDGRAVRLRAQAEELRQRFEDAYWCDELSTYALALDGDKRPCRVITSNPGHCLLTGIANQERAELVARTLLSEPSFSGWGIRTVAATERRFNPMSYHNGTVWPHDNALIAAGFGRYGLKGAAGNVLTALFEASLYFESHRLPELFCGFTRRADEAPTLYPVACSPQAWAAGAVFLCLQACLGLRVQSPENSIVFTDPMLPAFLDWVEIGGLSVGAGSADLVLTRRIDQAVVGVESRTGAVRVVTVK